MAVTWAGGESGTRNTAWYETLAGAVTVDTGVTLDGNATLKLDTSSPAATATATTTKSGAIADAGRRITRYVRFSALPAATRFHTLLAVQNSGGTSVLSLGLDSNGKLVLSSGIAAIGAVGSTTLSASTWYRVALSYTITSTTNWQARVYLGQAGDSPAYSGALEMSRSNADATLSATTSDRLTCTLPLNVGANITLNVTHTVVDDATDLADPGNRKTTAKLPTTTTTNNFDGTVGTGAVNERPVSTTNGKSHANTTDVDQDYEIEAASAGDADLTGATLVGNVAWIWATLGSLTGTPSTNIIRNGARETGTWDAASANVAQLFTVVSTSATYPANANGKNIGSSSSVIAADTFLYDCGVIIVYTPAAGGSGFKDAVARFRLASAAAFKDIVGRFRLASAATYRDAGIRLRLVSATAYRDTTVRFRLRSVTVYRDAGLRFKMVAATYRDATLRFKLVATGFKDATARFRFASPATYRDATTRLRLQSATIYRDANARLRLRATAYRDAGVRFLLVTPGVYRDATTRLRLRATGFRDATARLRLQSVTAYRDAVARLRLRAAAWRDASARLRVRAGAYRDAGVRFALQVITVQLGRPAADVGSATWHDQVAGTTNLFQAIDETVASDADYIESPDVTGSPSLQKVRLAALDDPLSAAGHILRVRYGKDLTGGDTVDLTVRLYGADGTTVIATRSYPGIDAATTVEITLSEVEANAIPDPDYATGLVLGFEAVAA